MLDGDRKGVIWVSLKAQGKADLPDNMKAFQNFYNQLGMEVALEQHLENMVQRVAMKKEYSKQMEGQLQSHRGEMSCAVSQRA